MTNDCPPNKCDELSAENERLTSECDGLKDENHQLRLLLRPIEVNHAALESPTDAQQPTPQGETTAAEEGGWADAEDTAVKPVPLEDREGGDV